MRALSFVYLINRFFVLRNHLFTRLRQLSKSSQNASQVAALEPGSALTTKVFPVLKVFNRSLIAERSLLFTRFLWTAEPTDFDTINPNRGSSVLLFCMRYTTMLFPTSLCPVRIVDRKSSADLSRFSRASKEDYADSSVRPLRRRAAKIARPARVFMRRRKP